MCRSAKVVEVDAVARQAFKSGELLGKTREATDPERTSQVLNRNGEECDWENDDLANLETN